MFMPYAPIALSQLSAPASYPLYAQTPWNYKFEPESEAEKDHRRTRGHQQGSKDKKPRKRRGDVGSVADASAGSVERPPTARGAPGSFRCASLAASSSGRHKPWKIVLTKENAEDIYCAGTTGMLAVAVCASLAEQHSAHAKVRARTTALHVRCERNQ